MRDTIARDGDLTIRRMRDDPADYALFVRWRNEPHVAEWWTTDDDPTPTTLERVIAHYGPRADHGGDTRCLIELNGRPIGYTQFYRLDAYPQEVRDMGLELDEDAFAIDIFVGETAFVGRGIGSRTVDALSTFLFEERGASQVAIVTAVDNHRAQRAYEKAGFRTIGVVLDTDVRDGERVRSVLMTRERPDLTS